MRLSVSCVIATGLLLTLSQGRGLACDHCNAILLGGVFNEHRVKEHVEYRHSIRDFLLTASYEEVKNARKAGLDLSLPIVDVPLGLGANFDEATLRKWQSTHKHLLSTAAASKRNYEVVQKLASKEIVHAWRECMISCHASQEGKRIQLEIRGATGKENEEFVASVSYTPKSGTDPDKVIIKNIQFTGAMPNDEVVLKAGTTVGQFSSVSQAYRRKGVEPVTIVIDFTDSPAVFVTLGGLAAHTTLTGIWYFEGQANKITASVERPGGRILLINEINGRTTGAMTGPETLIAADSGEWSPSITAVLKNGYKEILWSSGVTWKRVPDRTEGEGLTGIWYLNGRPDKACVLIQWPDGKIWLFNEFDGRTSGVLTDTGAILALASNEWSSITGEVSGDGLVIRWSSGVTWERQPKDAK